MIVVTETTFSPPIKFSSQYIDNFPNLYLNQQPEYKIRRRWLIKSVSRQLFEDVDEFLCRPTDPPEPLANNLGIV